jgi:hypothetical protein
MWNVQKPESPCQFITAAVQIMLMYYYTVENNGEDFVIEWPILMETSVECSSHGCLGCDIV